MEIYIIKETRSSFFKLGYAAKAKERLRSLQTGNPRKLKLYGFVEVDDAKVIKLEKKCHRELEEDAIRGEWFCNSDLDSIVKIIEKITKKEFVYADKLKEYEIFRGLVYKIIDGRLHLVENKEEIEKVKELEER